jgi:hypothetical protein
MISSGITEIHKTLGYSQPDEDALRKVRNIWKKLETLRAKAAKDDPAALRAYRELLEKSLVAARQVQQVEDPLEANNEFWAWYAKRCEELGTAELESRRGRSHQGWMQQWQPAKYMLWEQAVIRMMEDPTPISFQEAKDASDKMLRAYVEAFKDY